MKVLVINCGSSSLKYQLIDMDGEKVLCKGLCERIGIDGKFTYKPQIEGKQVLDAVDVAMPTHSEAIQAVLNGLAVSGHGDGSGLDGFLAGKLGLIGEQTVDADTLAQTLRQQLARGGVEQLILQGRRTCVDDQNIHKYTPFSEGACIAPEFPIK